MPKGIVAMILAKKKPEGKKEDADEIGMKALAKDLISSVKNGDEQGVIDAVKGMYHSCGVSGED